MPTLNISYQAIGKNSDGEIVSSVDHDHTASYELSDLALHCLLMH